MKLIIALIFTAAMVGCSFVGPDNEALRIQSNEAAVTEAARDQSVALGRPLTQDEWDGVRAKVAAERNGDAKPADSGKVGE